VLVRPGLLPALPFTLAHIPLSKAHWSSLASSAPLLTPADPHLLPFSASHYYQLGEVAVISPLAAPAGHPAPGDRQGCIVQLLTLVLWEQEDIFCGVGLRTSHTPVPTMEGGQSGATEEALWMPS
jgi:hypothetical protein